MDFATIIAQLGFPIGACIAMGWYVKYITDTHREDINKMNQSHKESEESIKDAIVNNTIVMTKICERMGGTENEDKPGDP